MSIIKKWREEKREYREYHERMKKLPKEYQIVFHEAEAYFWNFSSGDGLWMLNMIYGVIELFESASAEGKRVLEVTGDDVAGFCDGLLREWMSRTWTGKMREKLNEKIHKQLEELKNERD